VTGEAVASRPPSIGRPWPPFAPGNDIGPRFDEGNDAALTHGAWSARKVQPLADQLHASLERIAPWTTSEAFAGTVQSWAWAEGQASILRDYVDQHGHFDSDGVERPAVRTLDRIEVRLDKLRDALGLTPKALTKLLANAAELATATGNHEGLASVEAEGRRILAARFGEPSPPAPADHGPPAPTIDEVRTDG
jgi:hypothetical protein